MRIQRPHSGILIDKIPAQGMGGLIFAIGTVSLFLLGIPETRAFFALSLIAGSVFGAMRYYWQNQTRW